VGPAMVVRRRRNVSSEGAGCGKEAAGALGEDGQSATEGCARAADDLRGERGPGVSGWAGEGRGGWGNQPHGHGTPQLRSQETSLR